MIAIFIAEGEPVQMYLTIALIVLTRLLNHYEKRNLISDTLFCLPNIVQSIRFIKACHL